MATVEAQNEYAESEIIADAHFHQKWMAPQQSQALKTSAQLAVTFDSMDHLTDMILSVGSLAKQLESVSTKEIQNAESVLAERKARLNESHQSRSEMEQQLDKMMKNWKEFKSAIEDEEREWHQKQKQTEGESRCDDGRRDFC